MADNLKKSNPTPSSQKSEIWELESGKWQQESSGKGFKLVETNTGQKVSSKLTNADLQIILNLPKHPENDDWLYPPEFEYCAETGVELKRQVLSEEKPWIPPFGVLPINERKTGVVRGLNQSDFEFELKDTVDHFKSNPDFKIEPPYSKPYYQLLSIKVNSCNNCLLALSPATGDLYLYIEQKKTWTHLGHSDNELLSSTFIESSTWRCEAEVNGNTTELFIPTNRGLALLSIDALTLQFDAKYFGNTKCCASPIYFIDSIMQLVLMESGNIELMRFSPKLRQFKTLKLQDINISQNLTNIQAPVSTTKFVAWICSEGQIILERKNNTADLDFRFLPWESGLIPDFNMGCPFLFKDNFYQLCINRKLQQKEYIQINSAELIKYDSNYEHTCSGNLLFYQSQRKHSEPWVEPEHLDDNNSLSGKISHILPLLESFSSKQFLGLSFDLASEEDIAWLKSSEQKQQTTVIYDDFNIRITFVIFTVSKPWLLRFFVYKNIIWIYHSELKSIFGWSLK